MIYLAAPYWHDEAWIRHQRYVAINKAAAYLLCHLRTSVYSPITHNVPLAQIIEQEYGIKTGRDEELGHNFWVYTIDFPVLRRCDSLIVFKLDGWFVSKGVGEEIELAMKAKMPIGSLELMLDGEQQTFYKLEKPNLDYTK
jgi:hypothetical protein